MRQSMPTHDKSQCCNIPDSAWCVFYTRSMAACKSKSNINFENN